MRLVVDRFLDAGRPAPDRHRVFLSVLPASGGGYNAVVREMGPARAASDTELRLLRYDAGWRLTAEEPLGPGDDPRLFRWRGGLCVLAYLYDPAEDDSRFWIHDRPGEVLNLTAPGYRGKNWVPVPYGDRLLVVRSLEPFCVAEVDPGGACRTLCGEPTRDIGDHRGGGCAEVIGGRIVGWGHRTRGPDLHTVFRYEVDLGNWSVWFEDVEVDGLPGMGIVDPTSAWGGYVAVCATPCGWLDLRDVKHAVCRIQP